MTGQEIESAVRNIARKASIAVHYLKEPEQTHHFIYELARCHISHLVGWEALHNNDEFKTPEKYEWALNILNEAISKSIEESENKRAPLT